MCGIVGILKVGKSADKEQLLKEMMAPMGHRGPDAWGVYMTSNVGLGHLRLSIIDISNGHQPMNSPASCLSYNGEIYNYIELRKELEQLGRSFITSSDTEVVQQALEEWGPDAALKKFNGQFAILFWDKNSHRLIAARDRFGIRPLYYLQWKNALYFASEMKAFDAIPGYRREWSPQDLLTHSLMWNTLGSNTVFQDIQSLPGGHWASFSLQLTKTEHIYYDIGLTETHTPDSFEDCKISLREQLTDAVRLRLRSDVPVGCYLSGGIDSSVITLLVKQVQKERFKTFSVAFTDNEYDESNYQDEMVSLLNSQHIQKTIDADHINENFLKAAYHFERPVFRTAPLPLYLLSESVAKENIKVILTGEAADEILCGYDTFKEIQMLQHWENGASRDTITGYLKDLYPHLSHYKDEGKLGFLEMYYEGFLGKTNGPSAGLAVRMHNNQVLSNYFNKDWNLAIDMDAMEAEVDSYIPQHVKEWPVIKRNQYLEMKTLLSGYLLSAQGDRMAMAHSIEGRFPFLDHRIVDWAFQLPEKFKLHNMQSKYILKETFRDDLPASIINRPKRPYMAPDLKSFIRNGIPTEIAESFLNVETIKDYGLFDPKMVARMLFKHQRRKATEIGYRDNMLISFIISTQMVEYWIRNPQQGTLTDTKMQVRIIE